MTRYLSKYYYENVLYNQNKTAKPNYVWVADITTLKLFRNQKAYVFLCIDIYTNILIASTISKKTITTHQITKILEKAIEKRFKILPVKKLIINTDRGTQFSSKAYNNFVENYKNYFLPSMARENTPTDNAVAERFIRTFKEHAIYNMTIEEEISGALAVKPNFHSYRACLNKYVRSLNSKAEAGPHKYDTHAMTATMLMLEPNHPKATSEHIGENLRLKHVEQYKAESIKVTSILAELVARKGELVEKTPFDDFENKLALQLIDNRLNEIYSIIQNNPDTTRAYVIEVVEPIEDSLTELHRKIDVLLPKDKVNREVLPLRDPIDMNLFPFFFTNAGSKAKRRKDLKQAQLRLAYTLLYHTGLRVNEIRNIAEKDINDAVKTSRITLFIIKPSKLIYTYSLKMAFLN
jgi:transposase InsO family protein